MPRPMLLHSLHPAAPPGSVPIPPRSAFKTPTQEELGSAEWRSANSRLDADVFRGLREEMQREAPARTPLIFTLGNAIVMAAILSNSLQMGLAIQDKEKNFQLLWTLMEHACTAIFACEMVAKIYYQRKAYFSEAWNLLDFLLVALSIVSNWIFPLFNVQLNMGVYVCLRLLRCLRVVKLLRMFPALKLLVEGMFKSMVSLGWILVLLAIITYLVAIICYQVLDETLYVGMDKFDFDINTYFGDTVSAMLTMFNMCILAEWSEVVRPVWDKQPHVVLFVFVPYLMLGTFGVLNLIIGVITEQTMAASHKETTTKDHLALREKMKAIMRLTDEMFGDDTAMTPTEFTNSALRHPDFIHIMRSCNFPRGFVVANLHLMFDESNGGTVDKDEFVNGMFRLVFNDLSQHACTILLGISELKTEIKGHVETELDKICERHFGIPSKRKPDVDHWLDHEPNEHQVQVPVEPNFAIVQSDCVGTARSAQCEKSPLTSTNGLSSKLKPKPVAVMNGKMDVHPQQMNDVKDALGMEQLCADNMDFQVAESVAFSQLRQQLEQIQVQLRNTTEITKAQTSGVSTELANLRQELSQSHQAIHDKIPHGHAESTSMEFKSLRLELSKVQRAMQMQSKGVQNPPLAYRSDLPAEVATQVALALQPMISCSRERSQEPPYAHRERSQEPPYAHRERSQEPPYAHRERSPEIPLAHHPSTEDFSKSPRLMFSPHSSRCTSPLRSQILNI